MLMPRHRLESVFGSSSLKTRQPTDCGERPGSTRRPVTRAASPAGYGGVSPPVPETGAETAPEPAAVTPALLLPWHLKHIVIAQNQFVTCGWKIDEPKIILH